MNKQNVTNFFKGIKAAATEHAPEILTGLGIAGMITTTVLAVKATPKALDLIESAKEEKHEPLTKVETVKVAWKPYIPAAVTGVVSTACLIGASSVSARRNAALTAAYQLSTTALAEYKEKVVETIGEKKERAIHDKIAQDKVEKNPPVKSEVIFTGKGDTLCMDLMSGRPFRSSKNKIETAVLELNKRMITGREYCISLNEFYDEIGLPRLNPMGEDVGWRVDKGDIEIHYASILTEDDEPCLTIEFLNPPEYGYQKVNGY